MRLCLQKTEVKEGWILKEKEKEKTVKKST